MAYESPHAGQQDRRTDKETRKAGGTRAYKPDYSFGEAGANVKESPLNKGSDQNWRGKRGGAARSSRVRGGGK